MYQARGSPVEAVAGVSDPGYNGKIRGGTSGLLKREQLQSFQVEKHSRYLLSYTNETALSETSDEHEQEKSRPVFTRMHSHKLPDTHNAQAT
jgi:hypothetical protein